ncbi:phosphodiesterase [Yersinia enterocolitica]|uniref:phosphodiesterase n=1 Tax=Yersinia enterocolitica TaxID=630 RepID=UPI002876AFCE|nr:phosphodiesterase [Yersinia enterocolitica]HDL6899470.1 phosphodiesterase [Yersinia enterocolitica]HDL7013168.1 phosphodiesterase [Yersinia enterocolitica]HDL7085025.1 phosphodiesterase [Yersinia enterocolitica]HDL7478753.1 phosphodiesterase [Yersinia enterocolitica]
MRIISHRGYWRNSAEKNSIIAFERSFDLGYGIETDIRDLNRTLVISHDMPSGDELTLKELIKIMGGRNLPLALNIKSDGLVDQISRIIKEEKLSNSFVFDMSVPDQFSYINDGNISVFTRMSEYEQNPAFYKECEGVWLDAFHGTWYNMELISNLLKDNKQVCIVSPELHKREDYKILWSELRASGISKSDRVILCTDFPEDATRIFKEDI